MNLTDFGIDGGKRKTLIILGAGATRGASCVRDVSEALPPLDLDFFQQVARAGSSESARRLLEFVRTEYGHEVGLSMEHFFSEADYTNRFHRELNVDPGPYVKRYQKALSDFLEVLPALLNRTTNGTCEYHSRIARNLHTIDCVISFNYDCTMDRALRDNAGKRWDPGKESYGFSPSSGVGAWKRHDGGRMPKQSIRLLKLHGSLNWVRESQGEQMALAESTNRVKSLAGSIIPPTWFKDLADYPFGDIWKMSRKEIRTARIMVVIGYSVPDTDLFSRSLLKVEAGSKEKREKLDLLVIVNPDPVARRRFLDLVRGGVENSTTILEFDHLRDLDALLRRQATQAGESSRDALVDALESRLERWALRRTIDERLSELGDKQMKALYLIETGATPEEIAPLFAVTPSVVSTWYSEALEYLGWTPSGVDGSAEV